MGNPPSGTIEKIITVHGRHRRVALLAETVVSRGKLAGALKREYVDDDGGLHVRYDLEDLAEPALAELRRAQLTPAALALAEGLTPAQRARVMEAPHGTVVRGWARHGSVFHVDTPRGTAVVPRIALTPKDHP